MTDTLNEDGLLLKSASEILDELETSAKEIYGSDINLDSDSPDGQFLRIIQQSASDIRDLISQVYASFDPDQAIGVVLDQRASINSIERISGDFTITPIDITVDRLLTLDGLDSEANDPDATSSFTVQDDQGNQFLLLDTYEFTSTGIQSLSFRAKNLGKVETTINTITNPVTVIIGVTEINNSSAPTTVGADQETDTEFRERRRSSVANRSVGYLDSIEGGLFEVENVSDAKVYENTDETTDSDGIPPKSIWCVVEGGANDDIGAKIYAKKDAGAGMKGDIAIDVLRPNNTLFQSRFDRPVAEDLYIKFDLKVTTSGASFDLEDIKQYLVDSLHYHIGESAETSLITSLLSGYIKDGIPLAVEVSNNGADYYDYLETEEINNKFTLSNSRIDITILS